VHSTRSGPSASLVATPGVILTLVVPTSRAELFPKLPTRIASAAILDVERSRLYLDLIQISLAQNIPEAFETAMNSLGFEYQGDFSRRYYGQGKAEGKVEGRMELILKLLALRFGPLPDVTQTRVRSAQDAQLDAVAERMLTAKTLEEAVSQLF
jgi:hypothetical protein